MTETFNPIMKNCQVNLYGILMINNKVQSSDILPFWFTLSYILSELGTHYITSIKSNGYVYFRYRLGNREYDLREKQQFLKLRDNVMKEYNNWISFHKNKEKTKNNKNDEPEQVE